MQVTYKVVYKLISDETIVEDHCTAINYDNTFVSFTNSDKMRVMIPWSNLKMFKYREEN